MTRNVGLLACLGLAVLICGETAANAGQCQCPGTRVFHEKDGDGTPLYWSFDAAVVKDAPIGETPLVCYGRTVVNNSSLDVVNISWRVANFGRRFIPKKNDSSSCPMLEDAVAQANVIGPLNFGVSSEYYDTRIRPPRKGWVQKTQAHPTGYLPMWTAFDANVHKAQIRVDPTDFIPIRSTFDVNLSENSFANIFLYSYVSSIDRKTFRLQYELENRGNTPVHILINMPVSQSMIKDLPFASGFELPPGSTKEFRSTLETRVAVQPATVLVTDLRTKKGVAVDLVGVYAPIEGKRQYLDQDLFNYLR